MAEPQSCYLPLEPSPFDHVSSNSSDARFTFIRKVGFERDGEYNKPGDQCAFGPASYPSGQRPCQGLVETSRQGRRRRLQRRELCERAGLQYCGERDARSGARHAVRAAGDRGAGGDVPVAAARLLAAARAARNGLQVALQPQPCASSCRRHRRRARPIHAASLPTPAGFPFDTQTLTGSFFLADKFDGLDKASRTSISFDSPGYSDAGLEGSDLAGIYTKPDLIPRSAVIRPSTSASPGTNCRKERSFAPTLRSGWSATPPGNVFRVLVPAFVQMGLTTLAALQPAATRLQSSRWALSPPRRCCSR